MLRVTGPNEIVILLAFELRIADAKGMVSLCFPATAIESMEDKFAQGWQRTRRQATAVEQSRLVANIGRVPLPVTTLLETRLAARELLSLKTGDVVSLGYPVSTAVDVHVGQVRRFLGRLTTGEAGAVVRVERLAGEMRGEGRP
jgi:flagellar motor switch protein FliM